MEGTQQGRKRGGGNNDYPLQLKPQGPETKNKRRRNNKNKNTSSEGRPRADLPEELLSVISNKLNVADFLSFGKVCRSWRLAFSATKQQFMNSPAHAPLVLHISSRDKQSCYFIDISTGIKYKTSLPNLVLGFCLGVSSGYVIMQDQVPINSSIWVMNPITGHHLHYPDVPQCCDTVTFNDRAIFASYGTDPKDFLLVILSRVHHNVKYCIIRDTTRTWNCFSFLHKSYYILDMVVFDGWLFVLANNQIGILNLKINEVFFLELNGAPYFTCTPRFVSSKDRLLIVEFVPFIYPVQIYTINFAKREWVKLTDLGDQALFIGKRKCSKAVSTTNWGGLKNSVYYIPFSGNHTIMSNLDGQNIATLCNFKDICTNPRINCWYFLHQAYCLDNVRDLDG